MDRETHKLSEQAIGHSLATGDTDVDRETHSLSEQAIVHSLAIGDTDLDCETHRLSVQAIVYSLANNCRDVAFHGTCETYSFRVNLIASLRSHP